jgi:two-component system nitrate/nitrite response regulator NarL
MRVRCVIVDDNLNFLRAARELLEREGISVVGVASTGAQACRTCRELTPDVVLVDINLGGETGFDIARQLAANGGAAGAERPRLILISAYAGDDFEEMIADSPADSFLSKTALSGAAIRDILRTAPKPSAR